MDKLLAKDVSKGKITAEQASAARECVTVIDHEKGITGMRDVDMVVEVRGDTYHLFERPYHLSNWNLRLLARFQSSLYVKDPKPSLEALLHEGYVVQSDDCTQCNDICDCELRRIYCTQIFNKY